MLQGVSEREELRLLQERAVHQEASRSSIGALADGQRQIGYPDTAGPVELVRCRRDDGVEMIFAQRFVDTGPR